MADNRPNDVADNRPDDDNAQTVNDYTQQAKTPAEDAAIGAYAKIIEQQKQAIDTLTEHTANLQKQLERLVHTQPAVIAKDDAEQGLTEPEPEGKPDFVSLKELGKLMGRKDKPKE